MYIKHVYHRHVSYFNRITTHLSFKQQNQINLHEKIWPFFQQILKKKNIALTVIVALSSVYSSDGLLKRVSPFYISPTPTDLAMSKKPYTVLQPVLLIPIIIILPWCLYETEKTWRPSKHHEGIP